MEIIIDDITFTLPPKLLNEHIIDIGLYNLMRILRGNEGTPNLEKLEGQEREDALDKIDKRNAEVYPLFLNLLKAVGVSNIYQLPVLTTVNLVQSEEFQKWISSALTGFL